MVFTKSMILAVSKISSLRNKENKQKFIHMLREELCDIGVLVAAWYRGGFAVEKDWIKYNIAAISVGLCVYNFQKRILQLLMRES